MQRLVSRRAVLRATAVALGIGGSGCLSGGGETTPTATPTAIPERTPTRTSTPTPVPLAPVPTASFSFDYFEQGGRLVITHAGGEPLDARNTGAVTLRRGGGILDRWERPVSAGDSLTLSPAEGFRAGERIRVVWTAPGGDQSATLSSFSAPSDSRPTRTETVPQSSFSWRYNDVDDVLTVTYRVGRRLTRRNSGEVFVLVGTGIREPWPLPVDGGDVLRIEGVPRNRTATVYWAPPDGNRRVGLGSYRTPNR